MTEPKLPPLPNLDVWAWGYGYEPLHDRVRSYGLSCYQAGVRKAAKLAEVHLDDHDELGDLAREIYASIRKGGA